MTPQFRIIKRDSKYFVEYLEKKATIFNKAIWKPYITWSGLNSAYAFYTYNSALDELTIEVRRNAIINYLEL